LLSRLQSDLLRFSVDDCWVGDATRPFPRDRGAEKLDEDPRVGPIHKTGPKFKAGASEKLVCMTIEKENLRKQV